MGSEVSLKRNRSKMAFITAALFYLAGLIEMVTGLFTRGSMSTNIAIGAMFIAIGSVWTAIGAKYKKEDEQDT